jgi:CPA2 family monovalent cation:H+ antiporter-2
VEGIGLIQDLAIVLLAAGVAGTLCRRFGLSVIVGYLVAGMVIGPFTPPFSFVQDVDRIQTLSQVGLVFLMFGIGLGLSLTKLGRLGAPALLATGVGAVLMLVFTRALGAALGWSAAQSLYVSAMLMVSSSAVIAKVIAELNLGHERPAQVALGVTLLEDIVAVVMLTLLGAQASGGSGGQLGPVLAGMGAFVTLLVGAGLLMVPRLLRRLEARADPELQTIVVAGLLFLLAVVAARAGYSLALGAFLLGAIVAELPQRAGVERAFAGMRDLFSSVFFVSIGMMLDPRELLPVLPAALGLLVFVLVARATATTLGLVLCGTRPRDARRAGLLLTPLGEFTFIIAQLGVSAAVLPPRFYPLAVGLAILTVLVVPALNRRAEAILALIERVEPRWIGRALEAYHGWLQAVQARPPRSVAWPLVRGRLPQVAVEALLVTGIMLFAPQLLELLRTQAPAFGLPVRTVELAFWGATGLVALILLFALWRNLAAIALIVAEAVGDGGGLPARVVQRVLRALLALLLFAWVQAIAPFGPLGMWGWLVVLAGVAAVLAFLSRKLIFWHSEWRATVDEVLTEDPRAAAAARAAEQRGRDLEAWQLSLAEVVVPDGADYAGRTLAQLAIPARLGCTVLEIERNGHVVTALRPDFPVFPGDKLLLLGAPAQLATARGELEQAPAAAPADEEFRGSVLETFTLPEGGFEGRTLAALRLAQRTGVRVVARERQGERVLAPGGAETLAAGDLVLVAGTLAEIGAFRRWLAAGGPVEAAA